MQRKRPWKVNPLVLRSQRNRILPITGGDGSALSLDFTRGSLDSRLTFTRGGNATFVNLSGYIEYAGANMLRNSGWSDSNTTPTNWILVGNAPTIPTTGFRTFTVTTAATAFITEVGTSLYEGVTYSAVIEVSSVSGSATMANALIATASPTNEKWYQNGTLVTSSTVITSGTITYVFTAGNGSYIRCGLGSTGNTVTSQSVTLTKPRIVPGVSIGAIYYASTTSAGYYAPRFDYSTTNIGEIRGLLIEGQAINICPQSQALTTGWISANMNTPTNPAIADPFGGTSATWKLVATSTLATHAWRHSVITLTAAAHTFSFWAKAGEYDRIVLSDPGSGQGACTFVLTGSGTATVIAGAVTPTNPQITPYVNGWYRCSVTMVTAATTYAFGISGYPVGATVSEYGPAYLGDGSGVYATGMQIEIGSGASSYIPTGASQVTRNAELCSMTGTNFSSWFKGATSGTFLVSFDLGRWLGNLGDQGTQLAIGAYSPGTLTMLQSGNQTLTTSVSASIWGTTFNAGYASATINPKNNKAALTFNGLSTFATLNGVVGATATTTGSVSRLSLYIGSNDTRDRVNGTIRSVKYYPNVFTSAQLQALTAL